MKMEVQGDTCAFECMNSGHEPDIVSLNEAELKDVSFVGGSCVGLICLC